MESSIYFNQKVCYAAGKDQAVLSFWVFFTINSDVKPWETNYWQKSSSFVQNKLSYIKQSWLKKTLSHLTRLAHLCVFIRKIFISPRWDPGKIKWDPTLAGWLTSHMNTLYFYTSFLKKVRSYLGEPAHLTGPAHLHMNSPLINKSALIFIYFGIFHYRISYVIYHISYHISTQPGVRRLLLLLNSIPSLILCL